MSEFRGGPGRILWFRTDLECGLGPGGGRRGADGGWCAAFLTGADMLGVGCFHYSHHADDVQSA
jgi:hypothetical protein